MEQRIAQLEAALDTAPVGLATLDLDFRYLEVNRLFATMYGKPADAFAGRTVAEALPDWAAQIIPHLEECVQKGSRVECEIHLSSPATGRPAVFLRTCQPVRDAAGEMVGLSACVIDITARKQAEAEMRESEEHYRYSIELNPHIPWTCGPDGENFDISARWTALTGAKSGRITLADWAETPYPEDLPAVLAEWTRCREAVEPLDVEYRVKCRDGQLRWIRARAAARLHESGAILGWYGMNEDIHDRREIDAALREKTRGLERATEQLALLVREDHLTGLANRRHFDLTLEREMHSCWRTGKPLGLLMIDVDRFKAYNDTFGHVAGDSCLRRIAGALEQIIRHPGDLVARYGGEEFAIILPGATEEQAGEIAARALAAVVELGIEHPAHTGGRVTISTGVVAALPPEHVLHAPAPQVASDLIRAGDLALYAAKKGGRNRVVRASALEQPAASTV